MEIIGCGTFELLKQIIGEVVFNLKGNRDILTTAQNYFYAINGWGSFELLKPILSTILTD